MILAGGLGTRLLPLTKKTPKPMLPLGKKPILEHLIEWNKKNGVKSFVLCVSYLRKTIEDYFGDGETTQSREIICHHGSKRIQNKFGVRSDQHFKNKQSIKLGRKTRD